MNPGFTLLEVMLAISILALILVMIAGSFNAVVHSKVHGEARLDVDRAQVVIDRRSGLSLTQVAKRHNISRASVCRIVKEVNESSNAAVVAPAGDAGQLCQQAGAGL